MSLEKRCFTNASVSNESNLERLVDDFNARRVSWNDCTTNLGHMSLLDEIET